MLKYKSMMPTILWKNLKTHKKKNQIIKKVKHLRTLCNQKKRNVITSFNPESILNEKKKRLEKKTKKKLGKNKKICLSKIRFENKQKTHQEPFHHHN